YSLFCFVGTILDNTKFRCEKSHPSIFKNLTCYLFSMKVLFISSNDVEMISSGGSQCTNRNYLSIKEIVGPENIEVFQIRSRLNHSFTSVVSRIRNYSLGFNAGLGKREIK